MKPNTDNATAMVIPVFDTTVQILREQEAYPFVSFMADIGGILGLFIGFNFLMVWGWIVWLLRFILAQKINIDFVQYE